MDIETIDCLFHDVDFIKPSVVMAEGFLYVILGELKCSEIIIF